MAFTVANFGGDALGNLAKLMVTFWATSAIFIFVFLGALCRAFGFSLLKFIRLIKDEMLIVLGTSSSETVLPRLLAKYASSGAHPRVVGVVLPAGYSFNLDGAAIYLTRGQDRKGPAPRSRG
jgi:aerobic C4-dicarboxylate transport protein